MQGVLWRRQNSCCANRPSSTLTRAGYLKLTGVSLSEVVNLISDSRRAVRQTPFQTRQAGTTESLGWPAREPDRRTPEPRRSRHFQRQS
jgi:hypothetical protein